MAGHSKWKQIKHKKAATDNKRSTVWAKRIRDVIVAAKAGGGDPGGNARLRTAIDAAKAVGKLLAERAVQKGVKEVVFDRGSYLYHGRVKALADAARESGLSF